MQQDSNQRIVYLDLLRVLAIFAMIFQHVSSVEFLDYFALSKNWYIAAVGNSLVRWCVPVFVMISGALFLNPCRSVSYSEILKIRIPRLLIAYVFWTFFYVLIRFAYLGFDSFTLQLFIRRLLNSHFHLWFLPMMMGVYLLIPILRKITQDKKMMHYALAIWVVFVFVSFLQSALGFSVLGHFFSLFKMNIVMGYSGYFILGYFLSKHSFSKRQRVWVFIMGIVGALITISATLYFSILDGEGNEFFFNNLSIQVGAMATAVFVLLKDKARKCGKAVLRFVDFVKKDLFGVYLTHALWIIAINTEPIRHCCSEIITLPLITIVIFVLSLFTTKLLRMIPYLRKVVE